MHSSDTALDFERRVVARFQIRVEPTIHEASSEFRAVSLQCEIRSSFNDALRSAARVAPLMRTSRARTLQDRECFALGHGGSLFLSTAFSSSKFCGSKTAQTLFSQSMNPASERRCYFC